jgi:hypothetical protein
MATTRSKTLSQCEAAWKTGMPLKVTSDGFPIIMKPSMNCIFRIKGTQDVAYVGLPGSNRKDATDDEKAGFRQQVLDFLATIPRLTAEEMESAEEGVYTWLLYSKDGSAPQFAASKTETMLELGTVHYSIALSVGATAVHGAGELWKHGTEYTINFLSGTFMDNWRTTLPAECSLDTMQRFLQDKIKRDVFPSLFRGKTLTFTRTGFVVNRFFAGALTMDKLMAYVRAGFVVCRHPKDKVDECKSIKGLCENPMTLEQEMKGGDGLAVQGQRIPLTPRKAYLNRESTEDPGLSQAAKARLVFASRGMLQTPKTPKEQALAALQRPVSPASIGLGRKRKTKKAKAVRRRTRRRT